MVIPLAIYAAGAIAFEAACVKVYARGDVKPRSPWFFLPATICAAGWPIYVVYWWAER